MLLSYSSYETAIYLITVNVGISFKFSVREAPIKEVQLLLNKVYKYVHYLITSLDFNAQMTSLTKRSRL